MSNLSRALVALSVFAGGCIFFVDTTDLGLACRFDGDDSTACGKCVASSCQAAVNACCAADACKGSLGDLDRCGRGAGCATLLGTAPGVAPRDALIGCIQTSCAATCTATGDTDGGSDGASSGSSGGSGSSGASSGSSGGSGSSGASSGSSGASGSSGTSGTSGSSGAAPNCFSVGPNCRCTVQSGGNNAACDAKSMGVLATAVICCADTNYPANGSSCMCSWIGCGAAGSSCLCGPGNAAPGGTCDKPGDPAWDCCTQTGAPECICGDSFACPSGFIDGGTTCNPGTVICAPGQSKVSACNGP